MLKYLVIFFLILSFANSSANNKNKIIENLNNTKNLNFKFEQNLNGKIETQKLLNDGSPNISKDKVKGIGSWSESDIVFFLQTGIKPNGDFAGKEMSKIIENGTS